MRDWDPTDEVFLDGDDGPTAPDATDEGPTSPIIVGEDHTTRLRSEFEEDTVEEFFV